MALFGDSINPALFIRDYSGMARAGEIQAAGLMNLGDKLAGTIKDYAKEQKEAKNAVKASAAEIKAAATLFPGLKATLEPLGQELANEDTPISERAALAQAARGVLNMGIARETGNEDLALRQEGMRLQRDQFGLQQDRFGIESAAAGLDIASAGMNLANTASARELDDAMKATLGPSLLDQTLAIAPKGIRDDVVKNLADYTPAEKFALAGSIRAVLPKAEQAKAPTLATVAVPGGEQQVQWDPNARTFVPIQVGGLNPTGGVGDPGSGIEPPPDIALPGGVIDSGSGVGVDGQAGVLPPRIGFTPDKTKELSPADQIAILKFNDEQATKGEAARQSVAKSQTFLSALDNLEKSPGFSNLFGTNLGTPTWVAGSDAADSKVAFEQLKAMGFLEAVKGMTGMGALSDAEGKKLDVAYLGLQTSMSEAAAKKKISEIKETLQKGVERAAEKGLIQPAAPASPQQKGLSILQGLPLR
jgi:hypothetical protein